MAYVESAHQRAYFEWAALQQHARDAFAIPNGGRRDRREAARMQGEGVRAGIPDVMLPKARGGAHGLWIEFKAPGGRTTTAQAQRLHTLVADGYACVVAYSVDAAIEATMQYLSGDIGPSLQVLGDTRKHKRRLPSRGIP